MTLLKLSVFTALFSLSALVQAMAPVEVVALFKERAVIRSAEGQVMLKMGETSKFGATLLSANPHEAVVRYKGEVYRLGLSARV